VSITFGTFCSGIGAPEVAWGKLGWQSVFSCEVDSFCNRVRAARFTDNNLGDMTNIIGGNLPVVDVWCAGTPCQAFSVAGLRKGLTDERGNLTLVFVRLLAAAEQAGVGPQIVIWENVPGVLSDKSNAFGCFLAGLVGEVEPLVSPDGKWTNAGLVVGAEGVAAWRILDAQYFGLAQRRRRVFVVRCPAGGADPAQILFESAGLRRNTPPRRTAGERVAASLTRGAESSGKGGYAGRRREDDVNIVAALSASGRGTSRAGESRGQDPLVIASTGNRSHCLNGGGHGTT